MMREQWTDQSKQDLVSTVFISAAKGPCVGEDAPS